MITRFFRWLFRRNEPSTYQKFLAVHMHNATNKTILGGAVIFLTIYAALMLET